VPCDATRCRHAATIDAATYLSLTSGGARASFAEAFGIVMLADTVRHCHGRSRCDLRLGRAQARSTPGLYRRRR
jgi:hypothetical protein